MVCATYDPECYGCRLRHKALGFTAAATPTMRDPRRRKWRPKVNCSWEAGIAGEKRADGTFVPLLDSSLNPVPIKDYGERRREIDSGIKQLKSDPNVFTRR